MKKLLIGLLALASISSYATDCSLELSYTSGTSQNSERRIAKFIKRNLKKKGYSFKEHENKKFFLELTQVLAHYDDSYSYVFHKTIQSTEGFFQNTDTGEQINLESFRTAGFLSDVTGISLRKAIKKALTRVPNCR